LSAIIVVITLYSSLLTRSQFLYSAKNLDANRTLIGRRFTYTWDNGNFSKMDFNKLSKEKAYLEVV
jgi:hypothetical protein